MAIFVVSSESGSLNRNIDVKPAEQLTKEDDTALRRFIAMAVAEKLEVGMPAAAYPA